MGKSIFYCDIQGTYKDFFLNQEMTERKDELQRFADSLDLLCEINGNEEIYFSFVSTNHINDVIECIKEFMPFIEKSKHIKMGTSFSDKHKIIKSEIDNVLPNHSIGKHYQILKNLEHINNDINYTYHADIDKVFFADDSPQNHKFLRKLLPVKFENVHLICFIPGNDIIADNVLSGQEASLNGVIKLINKYIDAQRIVNSFKRDQKDDCYRL